jgi:hypothetical protein
MIPTQYCAKAEAERAERSRMTFILEFRVVKGKKTCGQLVDVGRSDQSSESIQVRSFLPTYRYIPMDSNISAKSSGWKIWIGEQNCMPTMTTLRYQ